MGYEFKKQQPNWSGFMQKHLNGDYSGKATVTFLLIINLNSSDESCIYSTLLFVEQQARQLNIPTPCITFDQPLFIKAFEISKAKSMIIVIRLGVFHLLMSFLGGIGTIMGGSGLTETMETIYPQNSVVHVLDGKAYAKALRCHFLIESSLQQIILNKMIYEGDSITQNLLIELQQFYNDLIEGTVDYFDDDRHENEKMEKVEHQNYGFSISIILDLLKISYLQKEQRIGHFMW